MDILPGIDRIKCKACGSTFLITGRTTASSGRAGAGVMRDNPVEVNLVKLPVNTICMNVKYGSRAVTIFDRDSHFSTADPWEKTDAAIGKKLRFLACIVYTTGEEYTLDIGDFAFNQVHLYYTGNGLLENSDVMRADSAGLLTEPRKTYLHDAYNNPGALAKPKYVTSYNTRYDSKNADQGNQYVISKMNALIRKYHIEFTDEPRYSSVYTEKYEEKGWFGRKTEKLRYWVLKYTNRRMYIKFGRELAMQYLSGEDTDKIDRMGRNKCIAEMANTICFELRQSASKQLENRELKGFSYNVLYDMLNLPSAEGYHYNKKPRFTNRSGAFILYSHYGMTDIKNTKLQMYLAANLKKEINKNLAATNDLSWSIADWVISEDTGPYEPYVEVKLMPEVKTVGVYNSWV